MRTQTAVLCALSLVALTGCPEEFGIEGRVNKAVHKDVMESIPKRCSDEQYRKLCGAGREQSKECRETCG
jgi:hypothetical protein